MTYEFNYKRPNHWMAPDHWTENSKPIQQKMVYAKTMSQGCYNPKSYEFDSSFKAYDPKNPITAHTTFELVEALENNPDIILDAKVIGVQDGEFTKPKQISREQFIENFKSNKLDDVRFKEDFNGGVGGNSTLASPFTFGYSQGNDFTPLLGGPFYKNLYYYQDYIRMHSEAFYAKNADPAANAIVQMTRDFVIGSSFEVQCDTKTAQGKLQMAIWKAFEEVNDIHQMLPQACEETTTFGEIMIWKLPNQNAKIIFDLSKGDTIPKAIIPRVRLLDPSNLVEIVTYPEDITRVLFYVWLTPTQWQMFQSGLGEGRPLDQKSIQPSLKFIYRTIMADQILHYKVNTVTGEKRGRSDFFPIFSYLKRVRDIVDYSLIALQKTAAWGIDTEVDGDQTDVDNYIRAQAALGTVAPAGSEFVHTTKIKRTMQANLGSSNINSDAFALGMSMIAMGSGFPMSYFGTHLSGGQTKASALVSTEPVAKKIEGRRTYMKRIIKDLWNYCMTSAGLIPMDCDIIFPEIITQDRSQKLKDLMLAESQRWLAPETVASIAAKELQVQNYNYRDEIEKMKQEIPLIPSAAPLSGSPTDSNGGGEEEETGTMGLTSQDKKQERINATHY